ncbi:MAG: AAA family ATPase, partial [Actinomycetota bacterium]|nr:AAA family ATPase [Actinomycetota bacterium]
GNDAGLAYLEYHASAGRAGGKEVLARGLTIASFRHLTSRALDPFPHHHNVVANAVVDEHGQRRALDARGLYHHAAGASAVATAEMRHRLTAALGVRWRRRRSGSWEIDGIPDEVLREFSRRRNEIEEAVAELEAEIGRRTSLDELQAVVAGTRPAKEHADPAELVADWRERATRHGFGTAQLAACTGRGLVTAAVDEERLFARLASPVDGVCAGHSLFTRADVLAALVDLDPDGDGPLLVDAAEVERLADAFLASEHVVALDTSGAGGALARQPHYTTVEMLAVQLRVADAFVAGASAGAAVVPVGMVDAALAAHPQLSGEQRHLVRSLCDSGRRVQCAIGRAGAGKTTTMAAAAEAWRAAGFEVVGAAVKGEAARQLEVGAGIATETVAWYLARVDNPPLHERSVLVVDEASTLSDRDLDALLHLAARTGAAVRLVGDPDQHGAVAAGGMFRHLCEAAPEATPELAHVHRVRHRADRQAARLLRSGHSREALALLAAAGHLHLAESDLELYVGMLQRWWAAHEAGDSHPMVDRRHATRRVLNRLARQLRRANGELGDEEVTATGNRRFAVGDRVVARMAARNLHVAGDPTEYVRNGATGTVVAVRADGDTKRDAVVVNFGRGTVVVPRAFFDEHEGPGGRLDVGIDHAYAVTSYGVQGAGFGQSTSRIDEGATRAEAYVDITRGREANHLFLTRSPDALDGEHLPKAPAPRVDRVAERIRRSGPERAAVEFPAMNSRPAHGRVAAAALLADGLPRPVGGPAHLRRRWDEVVAAVAAYRDAWRPEPGGWSWGWALGARVPTPAASAERAQVIDRLERFAHAYVLETGGADTNRDRHEDRVRRLRDGDCFFAGHPRASHRAETDRPGTCPTTRRGDTDTPVAPQQPTRRRSLRR